VLGGVRWDPLAKLSPARWGGRPLAELMLEWLVGRDLDLAPPPRAGIGALRAQRTRVTRRCRKLNGKVELEALLLARQARDRPIAHVDRERVLAEVVPVPCDPGPADDQPPACANFIDDGVR